MSIKKSNYSIHPICQRIGQIIKNCIPEISKKMGLPDATVRKWVNGSVPGADKIVPLCEAAGISVTWLITGEEKEFWSEIPYHVKEAVQDTISILTSDDASTSMALIMNIKAFKDSLDRRNVIENKDREISTLKNFSGGTIIDTPPIDIQKLKVMSGTC